MSCNEVVQPQHAKECRTLAPGSSPYMVTVDGGLKPAHRVDIGKDQRVN